VAPGVELRVEADLPVAPTIALSGAAHVWAAPDLGMGADTRAAESGIRQLVAAIRPASRTYASVICMRLYAGSMQAA
jgi:hypothetical protein